MAKKETRWMRVRGIAKHLGVSPQWVYNRTMRGTIPFHRRDGQILLFDADEIDEWLKSKPPLRRPRKKRPEDEAPEDGRAKLRHRGEGREA